MLAFIGRKRYFLLQKAPVDGGLLPSFTKWFFLRDRYIIERGEGGGLGNQKSWDSSPSRVISHSTFPASVFGLKCEWLSLDLKFGFLMPSGPRLTGNKRTPLSLKNIFTLKASAVLGQQNVCPVWTHSVMAIYKPWLLTTLPKKMILRVFRLFVYEVIFLRNT